MYQLEYRPETSLRRLGCLHIDTGPHVSFRSRDPEVLPSPVGASRSGVVSGPSKPHGGRPGRGEGGAANMPANGRRHGRKIPSHAGGSGCLLVPRKNTSGPCSSRRRLATFGEELATEGGGVAHYIR